MVGATGNVGSSVVEALVADPRIDEVIGVARRAPEGWRPEGVRFVTADIGDDRARDTLAAHFSGADAVVHLGWLFQPTHDPMVTWQANAIGSIRVFEAAAAAGVGAVVHASSVGAYSPGPADGSPVDESWPTHSVPTAGYGREKAYVERALDAFEHEHPEVRVVRLRPGFIFKRESASEQRRLFLGPFAPASLLRPGRLPILPYPAGVRIQALHSADAADAFVRAVTNDVRGAFNVAAEPVLDGPALGRALGARTFAVPPSFVRAALAAAWHAHLVPADPALFDLTMALPVMDTTRARTELGWTPQHSASEAVAEVLDAMAHGEGGGTLPLAPDSPSGRIHEVRTGVGERP